MKNTLKKLTVLLVLTTLIASCAKDPTIVGKWKLKKINFENQMVANMLMGYTQQAVGKVIEFKADGTVASEGNESQDVDGQIRYAVDGTNINFTVDVDMTVDSVAIDTTMDISGTYELPDKSTLKMRLGFPLPENQGNLKEIFFNIEAERQ